MMVLIFMKSNVNKSWMDIKTIIMIWYKPENESKREKKNNTNTNARHMKSRIRGA